MTIEELAEAPSALIAEAAEEEEELAALLAFAPGSSDGFRIDSEERAAWLVEKILTERDEIARVEAQAKAMIARKQKRLARLEAFVPQLQDWAAANLDRGKRSRQLLTGTVQLTARKAAWKVTDAKAAQAWAEAEAPDLLVPQTKLVLDKEQAIRRASEDGEAIPGVEYIEAHDALSIRAAKEAP